MRTIRRVLSASGSTGLILLLASVVPAQASIKGSCTLSGNMKVVDKTDLSFGMRDIGGSGKFTFADLDARCEADTNKDLIPETTTVAMEATGWYESIACGTGKAVGTITNVVSNVFKYNILENQKFGLEFRKFQAGFHWHDWDKPDVNTKIGNPEDPGKEATTKTSTFAGPLTLAIVADTSKPAPTPEEVLRDRLRGNCTKALSATGKIAVDFTD